MLERHQSRGNSLPWSLSVVLWICLVQYMASKIASLNPRFLIKRPIHPTNFEGYLWTLKQISPELTVLGRTRSQKHQLCSFNLIPHYKEYRLDGERFLHGGYGMDIFVEEFRCSPLWRAWDITWLPSILSFVDNWIDIFWTNKTIFLYLSSISPMWFISRCLIA